MADADTKAAPSGRALPPGPPVRPRPSFDRAAFTRARVSNDISIRRLAEMVSRDTGLRVTFDAMRRYSRGGRGVPEQVVKSVSKLLNVSPLKIIAK